jgi:hypothetical protein
MVSTNSLSITWSQPPTRQNTYKVCAMKELDDDILTHLYEKLRAKWFRSSNSFLAPGRVVGYRGMGPGSSCPDFQTKHSMTPSPPNHHFYGPTLYSKRSYWLVDVKPLRVNRLFIHIVSSKLSQSQSLSQMVVWTLYRDCNTTYRCLYFVAVLFEPSDRFTWCDLCRQERGNGRMSRIYVYNTYRIKS